MANVKISDLPAAVDPNDPTSIIPVAEGAATVGITVQDIVDTVEAIAVIPVERMDATGTPDSTTYLRGDGSWSTPAGGSLSVQTVTSSATVTPTDTNDLVEITAQAVGLTVADPSGSPANGWGLVIRIKDDGTARAITWGSGYRAIGVTLPTTTVTGKQHYIGAIYNSADSKWDVVSVGVQA